jgi:hypothetical protein
MGNKNISAGFFEPEKWKYLAQPCGDQILRLLCTEYQPGCDAPVYLFDLFYGVIVERADNKLIGFYTIQDDLDYFLFISFFFHFNIEKHSAADELKSFVELWDFIAFRESGSSQIIKSQAGYSSAFQATVMKNYETVVLSSADVHFYHIGFERDGFIERNDGILSAPVGETSMRYNQCFICPH